MKADIIWSKSIDIELFEKSIYHSMPMRKKHIAIEILPRAVWFLEAVGLYLVHHFASQPPELSNNVVIIVIGIFLVITGTIYAVWALRFLARPMITKELVTDGPYRFSRHPMYVAIYIVLIGIGLLFFSQLWFLVLLIFIPIWYFICKLEEDHMENLHSSRYLTYKQKTHMFLPRIMNN